MPRIGDKTESFPRRLVISDILIHLLTTHNKVRTSSVADMIINILAEVSHPRIIDINLTNLSNSEQSKSQYVCRWFELRLRNHHVSIEWQREMVFDERGIYLTILMVPLHVRGYVSWFFLFMREIKLYQMPTRERSAQSRFILFSVAHKFDGTKPSVVLYCSLYPIRLHL